MPTFTQLATDTFTRANESPLNTANWTIMPVGGYVGLQIVSNICEGTGTVAGNGELYTGVVFPPDQYSEITLNTIANSSVSCGAGVRCSSGENSLYFFLIPGTLGTSVTTTLYRKTRGTTTTLGTFVGTPAANDVWRIYAQGTAITVTQNGTSRITATDESLITGLPGMFIVTDATLANGKVSLWSGGRVDSGRTATGRTIIAADSCIRPNVAAGANYNGNWLRANTTDLTFALTSNEIVATSAVNANVCVYVNVTTDMTTTTGGLPAGSMWPDDQWASARIFASTGASDVAGVVVRSNTGAATATYYLFFVSGGAGNSATFTIRKYLAGVTSTVATAASQLYHLGDTLRLHATGGATTTLTAYRNGTQVLTGTDSSSPITSGTPGMYVFKGTTATSMDSWMAGGFGTQSPMVVFTGDSIISRWDLVQQFGLPYVNTGIGSQTSAQILARFYADVLGLDPTIVVIEGGRNGIAAATETAAQTAANMATMGANARAQGISVVYTDTIASGGGSDPPGLNTAIDALNVIVNGYTNGVISNWNLAICQQTVPTAPIAADYLADLVHPNTAGYALLGPVASASIASLSLVGNAGSLSLRRRNRDAIS